MVKIRILCVGKLKDKFFREAFKEYEKRLKAFCKFELIEVKDEKESPSVNKDEVINKEGNKLLSKMTDGFFIALEPYGKELSSEDLANNLENLINTSRNPITFIIGGSHGLSKSVLDKCQMILSFSKMTFPHQLFRIMLAEQIYRAFTIINHQTYHK